MGRTCKLKPGDVVNRAYEVNRLIGFGYSGEVWHVHHRILDASFALKLLHEEDRDDEHKTSRFGAEAAALFGLDHHNVVRVHEAGTTDDGLPFTVMELLHGETLAERLQRGRLHPLRALKYAYDIACGLDAAHEIGVVHRDVKPENIFLTLEDVAKLLDFTAAKFHGRELRTTKPADHVGTLAFMSPEHIRGTTSDARIDQYSLALVLYCMLRGAHPFQRHMTAQYELMNCQFNETPAPLAKVAALPAWLDELLAPALEKLYERRYPTMAHFARAIHEGMRRLSRELHEGLLHVDTPLGDPPIDVEGDAAPGSRRHYVAPEEPGRQPTGPVMPSKRVTFAPGMLPDAATAVIAEGDDDAPTVRVAPLLELAASRSATTAPTPPMTSTAPVPAPPRSRWLVVTALLLALPAAGGLFWRWTTRPVEHAVTMPAVTSRPAPEPSVTAEPEPPTAPSVTAAPEPPAASSAAVPAALVETAQPTAPTPPPACRPPRSTPKAPPREEPAAVVPTASPTAPAPPPAPPQPTANPHRLFGADE